MQNKKDGKSSVKNEIMSAQKDVVSQTQSLARLQSTEGTNRKKRKRSEFEEESSNMGYSSHEQSGRPPIKQRRTEKDVQDERVIAINQSQSANRQGSIPAFLRGKAPEKSTAPL